jgi:RND family efflux transporter MFP subunit
MHVGDVDRISGRKFPGRAAATQEVDLAFRVSGPLIARDVFVGKELEEGDLIAQIDPRDFQVALASARSNLQRAEAQLAAMKIGARPEELEQLRAAVARAEATFARADQDLARARQLVPSGTMTRAEYDRVLNVHAKSAADLRLAQEELNIGERGARQEDIDAQEAEIRQLEAAVDEAQNQLDDTYLRATFAGTIVATHVENFENVRAGQKIVRLIDKSRIEFEVNIPETLISLAPHVGDIRVTFDAFPDVEIPAKIQEIGTEASQTTRTFPVTLIMDQPEEVTILPGMAGRAYGTGRVAEGVEQPDIVIPVTAVFAPKAGSKSFAWVIDPQSNLPKQREIQIGKLVSGGYLVDSGLEIGEIIAVAGVHFLDEDVEVRPVFD